MTSIYGAVGNPNIKDVRSLPHWQDDENVKDLRAYAQQCGLSAHVHALLVSEATMGMEDIDTLLAICEILGIESSDDYGETS